MGKMHQEGVTLIELLVTLGVVAIIVAVGVPAMRDFFATNQMSAATNDVLTSLHLARSEAVKRDVIVRLCPSDNWDAEVPACSATADLGDGWIIVADPLDTYDVLLAHEQLPDSITVTTDFIETVDFGSNGRPVNANAQGEINIVLCDDRGNRDMGNGRAAGRWVNVRGPGRPRIYDRLTDVQGALGGC